MRDLTNEALHGYRTSGLRGAVSRRRLLHNAAALAAGSTLLPKLPHIGAAQRTPSTLIVGVDHDYEALVHKTLKPLGGIEAFVKKGDNVVIKPNLAWDRTPEQAANTHPLIVATLVRMALDAGARRVTVFDRTCHNAKRSYVKSGIAAAMEKITDRRARLDFINDRYFVNVPIAKGKDLNQWQLYKPALEADVYINVPVAKHHRLTRLTLGLKNVMGIMGGQRGNIHKGIEQKLADLATVVQPELTLIDGTRILLDHGPVGGNLKDVEKPDTLIATTDPVAADAYATTLHHIKPEEVASTRTAAAMGLGEMDLNKVNITKV